MLLKLSFDVRLAAAHQRSWALVPAGLESIGSLAGWISLEFGLDQQRDLLLSLDGFVLPHTLPLSVLHDQLTLDVAESDIRPQLALLGSQPAPASLRPAEHGQGLADRGSAEKSRAPAKKRRRSAETEAGGIAPEAAVSSAGASASTPAATAPEAADPQATEVHEARQGGKVKAGKRSRRAAEVESGALPGPQVGQQLPHQPLHAAPASQRQPQLPPLPPPLPEAVPPPLWTAAPPPACAPEIAHADGMGAQAGEWRGFDAWAERWEDAPEESAMVGWVEETDAWREEKLRRREEREAEEERLWPCALFAPRHKSVGDGVAGGAPDYEALPPLVGDAKPGDEIAFQAAELSAAWEPCLVWRTATVREAKQGELTLGLGTGGSGEAVEEMIEQQANLTELRLMRRSVGCHNAAEELTDAAPQVPAGGGTGTVAPEKLPRKASRRQRRRSREGAGHGDAVTQAPPRPGTEVSPSAVPPTEALPLSGAAGGAYSRRRSAARQVDFYFSQARAVNSRGVGRFA